jgi:hypothetical protein
MPNGNAEDNDVPEPVADLLNRIAVEWVAPRFADRNISTLSWLGGDLSTQARRVQVRQQFLEITCSLPRMTVAEARAQFHDDVPFARRQGPLAGTTEDGLSFSASNAMATGSTQTIAGTEVEKRYFIRAFEWRVWNEKRPARLWVAPVDVNGPQLGNLLLSSARGSSWGNVRLTGASYTYYLLNLGSTKSRTLLALDVGGARCPEPSVLRRELTYLSFAFGSSVSVETLMGVDDSGRFAGAVGGSFVAKSPSVWWDSVVPMFDHPFTWFAPLFRKLCEFHASQRDDEELAELVLAIWYLLSSYREYAPDLRRTQVFVGLTCAARFIERSGSVLADPVRWEKWLSEHQDAFKDIAVGTENVFLEQLKRAVTADNLTIINAALTRVGLKLPASIQNELQAASTSLTGHPLVVSADQLDESAVLRSLLVALVASAVGYRGAIAGWHRVGDYFYWDRADESWWPVSREDEAEAELRYVAKSAFAPASIKDLWPRFSILTVPNTGPLGSLVSFATALALKTDGKVAAKVVAVPRETEESPQLFDFVLYAIERPGTRSVLFSAYEKDAQTLVVLDWDEERDIVVEANDQLELLLASIASSPETRLRIERLALAADLESA